MIRTKAHRGLLGDRSSQNIAEAHLDKGIQPWETDPHLAIRKQANSQKCGFRKLWPEQL